MSFDVEHLQKQPEHVFRNVRCDGCNEPLQLVGEQALAREDGSWPCLQPADALEVILDGGYGMAIDPIDTPELARTLLFCKACTAKLCTEWPAFARIINDNS